ncbi:MAG: hypothetical protein IKK75_15410 [Clostridia bacterium]|nr:hypothetical protein [Clostridia bacterium]
MKAKHHLSKEYYERLAKLLLENALPDTYSNLIMLDRPDLLSTEQDEGIEVVRSLLLNEGEAEGRFKRMVEKKPEDIPPKDVEAFEMLGYKTLTSNEVICGYTSISASWISIEPIQKNYIKKINKLPHYCLHSVNSLFIFAPLFNYYDCNDILEFFLWVEKTNNSYSLKYDKVFVYDEPNFHLYDSKRSSICSYRFPQEIIHKLCERAKAESNLRCPACPTSPS